MVEGKVQKVEVLEPETNLFLESKKCLLPFAARS